MNVSNEVKEYNKKLCERFPFLIPTNAEVNKFEYKPYNGTKTISGKRSQNYEYTFTFQISLSYEPELIIDLLTDNKISNQQDFEQYLDATAAYLAQRAADFYISKFMQNQAFLPESVTISELTNAIAFYKDYPDFDINVLALTEYKLPYLSYTSSEELSL